LGPDGKVILRVTGPLTQRNMTARVLPALKAAGISLR
jgi:cytochrome c biogenesis protein CcmG/thiol:disulfide interchange protein DsbE